MIIMVFGLPGSGKSFFAAHFANMIQADYVNSDRLRKQLFAKRSYSDSEKAAVYDEMLSRMRKACREEKNMVLDATFHKAKTRDQFLYDESHAGNIYCIEVVAEESLIRERLKKIRPDSEADYTVYRLIRDQWEPMERPHLVLPSTNDNLDKMLQKALEYLHLKV